MKTKAMINKSSYRPKLREFEATRINLPGTKGDRIMLVGKRGAVYKFYSDDGSDNLNCMQNYEARDASFRNQNKDPDKDCPEDPRNPFDCFFFEDKGDRIEFAAVIHRYTCLMCNGVYPSIRVPSKIGP